MTIKLGWFLGVAFILASVLACSDDATTQDSGAAKPDAGMDAGTDLAPPDTSVPDSQAAIDSGPDVPVVAPDLGAVPALKWEKIKAGAFKMGTPTTEVCREPEATKETEHQVTLTRDFLISTHEVTQAQFAALLWYNPAKNKKCGLTCPVEMINWHEAAAYVNALSKKEGLTPCYACTGKAPKVACKEATAYASDKIYTCPGYRMPTEAEWEYAYRAGTTTALYTGDLTKCMDKDPVAEKTGWYKQNSGGASQPVGQKPANPWKLYDMAGGVWEWCNDWWSMDLTSKAATDPGGGKDEFYRIIRGGSWFGWAYNLRAGHRFQKPPTYRCHGIGLRPARTAP